MFLVASKHIVDQRCHPCGRPLLTLTSLQNYMRRFLHVILCASCSLNNNLLYFSYWLHRQKPYSKTFEWVSYDILCMHMEKIIWNISDNMSAALKAFTTNFLLNNNLSWSVAYRLSFVYNKPGKVASILRLFFIFF